MLAGMRCSGTGYGYPVPCLGRSYWLVLEDVNISQLTWDTSRICLGKADSLRYCLAAH